MNRNTLRQRDSLLPLAVIAPSCLLAFLLRVFPAARQGIWGDEIYTVWYSRMSFFDIIKFNVTNLDAHAPLFYFIVKVSTLLGGHSELVLRLPSILLGVLNVPLVYLLGKRLVNRPVGLIGAVVMAVNPFQVLYGQEGRGYALAVFFTLLSVLFFLRILEGERSRLLWAAYACATVLGVASHYYVFFVVLFENLFVLIVVRKYRFNWRPWMAMQAVLLLPLLVGLWQVARMMALYQTLRLPVEAFAMLRDYLAAYSLGGFVGDSVASIGLLLFGVLSALGLGYVLTFRKPGALLQGSSTLIFLLLYFFVPFVGAVAYFWLTGGFPPRDRYLIIVTPAFYLTVSAGIVLLRRFSLALLAVGLLLVLAPQGYALERFYQESQYARPDYRVVASYIEAQGEDGDVVVAISHLVNDVFREYYKGSLPLTRFRYYPEEDTRQQIEAKLEKMAGQYKRIWLLPLGTGIDDPEAEEWLNGNAFEIENMWLGGARIALYQTGGLTVPPKPLGTTFGNRMELKGFSIGGENIAAGEAVRVALRWRVFQEGSRDKMTVRLTDVRGHVIAQKDRPVGGLMKPASAKDEEVGDNVAVMVPYGTIPGPVSVEVGLYPEEGGDNLTFVDASGKAGIWLQLAKIEVARGALGVPAEKAGIEQLVGKDMGGGLRVAGYELGQKEIVSGNSLTVTVLWEALTAIKEDMQAAVELVDADGRVMSSQRELMSAAYYPMAKWVEGEAVRDIADLPVPPSLEGGKYNIRVTSKYGQQALLGEITVKAREHKFEMPEVQHPTDARWDNLARLRGFDLKASGKELSALSPGEELDLTLYWMALDSSQSSYTVFTHLVDNENQIWGQHDGLPDSGNAPTSGWVSQEIIVDSHRIAVKPDAPPGQYAIEVGLYDPATGQRLKLDNGADHFVVTKVQVVPK